MVKDRGLAIRELIDLLEDVASINSDDLEVVFMDVTEGRDDIYRIDGVDVGKRIGHDEKVVVVW